MIYDLESAHKYSSDNKLLLKTEQKCGCFCCKRVFSSSEIKDWIDEGNIGTALCPYCFIDSVIGENTGYDITEDFLRKMNLYWFESGVGNRVSTSFGELFLTLDGKMQNFRYFAIDHEKPFADVNGIYKIEYDYNADGNEYEIRLTLDNRECNAVPDTGEHFDAVSADIGEGRITLAFIEPKNFDFEIEYMKDGITLRSNESTASQTLKFGVCWIEKRPTNDDIQTWLGADVK